MKWMKRSTSEDGAESPPRKVAYAMLCISVGIILANLVVRQPLELPHPDTLRAAHPCRLVADPWPVGQRHPVA